VPEPAAGGDARPTGSGGPEERASSDESPRAFYDALAADYDVLFDDWWAAAQWHASTVERMLQSHGVAPAARLLDCACGIGTQALGLAARGYEVTGSDVSANAVERARREAVAHGIDVELGVGDMRALDTVVRPAFDVVIACDNALPHLLTVDDLDDAIGAITRVLAPGGLFLASVRDYDALRRERPSGVPPIMRKRDGKREIVGQAWEWSRDGEQIRIHLFVVREDIDGWHTDVHTTWYRALTRAGLTDALTRAGLEDVRWHMPDESGYYQPMVTARAAR
jgi:glycine/sarcosine N-methyltransferase